MQEPMSEYDELVFWLGLLGYVVIIGGAIVVFVAAVRLLQGAL